MRQRLEFVIILFGYVGARKGEEYWWWFRLGYWQWGQKDVENFEVNFWGGIDLFFVDLVVESEGKRSYGGFLEFGLSICGGKGVSGRVVGILGIFNLI